VIQITASTYSNTFSGSYSCETDTELFKQILYVLIFSDGIHVGLYLYIESERWHSICHIILSAMATIIKLDIFEV